MTKWQLHVEKWKGGCGDPHCELVKKVVLGKGKLPCDILFIGEAPGDSEDVVGIPFVGPAGRELDQIVMRALARTKYQAAGTIGLQHNSLRLAYTNMVGCLPKAGEGKERNPEDDQIMACLPRVEEFVQLADPKLVVCVGKVADDYTDQRMRDSVKFHKQIPRVAIQHPAKILMIPVAGRGLARQRAEVDLAHAVEDHL